MGGGGWGVGGGGWGGGDISTYHHSNSESCHILVRSSLPMLVYAHAEPSKDAGRPTPFAASRGAIIT
jgi:hypothetical protein